jgi:hypothetical protein
LWPDEGADDWPLLIIPVSDALDKVPEFGPSISIEVMLVWTAMMTISIYVKLHAITLVIRALGAMNGEIDVFLSGLEFENSSLARVIDRH